jgi:hypothetical protein
MARKSLGRRRAVRLSWYAASVAYSGIYILLAARIAGPYGLPVSWFIAVELVATVPYTLGVARLVEALVDRRTEAAIRWGMLAGAGFFAPDVFILAATPHRPAWLVALVLTWITISSSLAARSLRERIRARRAGRLLTPVESLVHHEPPRPATVPPGTAE